MQITSRVQRPQLGASRPPQEKEHHYEDMRDAMDRMGDGTRPSWWGQACKNGRLSNGEYVLGKTMTLGTMAFAATVGYLHTGMSGALLGGAIGAPLVALEIMVNG